MNTPQLERLHAQLVRLRLFKSRERGLGARGWPWFAAWVLVGAIFVFSFVTGFSIGLFLARATRS